MIYAQIKDNIIINIIVLDDIELIPLFSKDYDHFIEVYAIPGNPGIGWVYNPESNSFLPSTDNS